MWGVDSGPGKANMCLAQVRSVQRALQVLRPALRDDPRSTIMRYSFSESAIVSSSAAVGVACNFLGSRAVPDDESRENE